MPIIDRLAEDMKNAMKARDQKSLDALRLIKAETLKKSKEGPNVVLDDPTVIAILQKMVKQRKDSIIEFVKGNREDLANIERGEWEVIDRYLPAGMSEDEIRAAAEAKIAEVGATSPKEMGKVMGPLMKELKAGGKSVDGDVVKKVIEALLLGKANG